MANTVDAEKDIDEVTVASSSDLKPQKQVKTSRGRVGTRGQVVPTIHGSSERGPAGFITPAHYVKEESEPSEAIPESSNEMEIAMEYAARGKTIRSKTIQ